MKLDHRATEDFSVRLIHGFFWLFIPAYGLFQVIQWRNVSHCIDLISYLDVADAYLRCDWQAAANSHWSPMYSWLLALVFGLFHPAMENEMLAVRLTNFACLIALMFVAVVFGRTFLTCLKKDEDPQFKTISEWQYWLYYYSLFSFSALVLGGCEKDTPDLLVSSFILIAANVLLLFKLGARSNSNFALFGCTLGLGYLAKSVVLPLSLIFYLGAWWEMRNEKGVWKKLLFSGACQLCFAVPFIIYISANYGYFTISDIANRLSLFCNTQMDQQVHFELPGLIHTSRKVFEHPDVFEFAEPIKGTYPPWYNMPYWTVGYKEQDPMARMLKNATASSTFILVELLSFAIIGYLLSSIGMRRLCISLSGIQRMWTIAAPSLVAICIYAVTANQWNHYMERYYTPWIVLLYCALLAALRFPNTKAGALGMRLFVGSVGGSMFAVTLAFLSMHNKILDYYPYSQDIVVAKKLQELGLKPGDRVAHLGFRRYYWARLARLKIVADIFDTEGFWKLDPERRQELIDTLKRYKVKAIVRSWKTGKVIDLETTDKTNPGPPWIPVPPTHALIYMIDAKQAIAPDSAFKPEPQSDSN